MRGAPIRFLVAVVGGWTCIRIAVLLPGAEPLAIASDVLAAPPAAATGRAEDRASKAKDGVRRAPVGIEQARPGGSHRTRVQSRAEPAVFALPGAIAISSPLPTSSEPPAPQAVVVPTSGVLPGVTTGRRWSVSAWLLARGGANGTLSGGQLGASQAGARVLYRLDARRRLALAGRIATPLRGRGTEAAIGVDWQPTAAPVHLVAEQRFGIDGARGGPTLMAIAGIGPTPVAAGFWLEAYAQVGAILRDARAQAFGDGALRLTRPVASLGRAKLDLGAGAWAAGQPGAKRVDIGPTLGIALPVANRSVRLSLDWRQRMAGDARPGSGPALSIGADF